MDKNLNELLKWSIENSTPNSANTNSSRASATATAQGQGQGQPQQQPSTRALNPEALASLLGGPSDAELMRAAMGVITSADPAVTLDDKLTAFDNFEQLVESLDNANNMASLSLWSPLLGMLEHPEADLRRYAAWCVGTAVQNNAASQERLLALGGVPTLVRMALAEDEGREVRRKAVYALSSAVRNYQPAMDVAAAELHSRGQTELGKVDATNMSAVDEVMNGLKEQAAKASA